MIDIHHARLGRCLAATANTLNSNTNRNTFARRYNDANSHTLRGESLWRMISTKKKQTLQVSIV